MLAINVTISNATVAHLEQFQLWQLRNQSKRLTDVGTDWKPGIERVQACTR